MIILDFNRVYRLIYTRVYLNDKSIFVWRIIKYACIEKVLFTLIENTWQLGLLAFVYCLLEMVILDFHRLLNFSNVSSFDIM